MGRWLGVGVMLSLLSGCAMEYSSKFHEAKNQPDPAQLYSGLVEEEHQHVRARPSSEVRHGSLWKESYTSRLYDNMYRATKVGDTVQIVVAESAKAAGSGTTKTNRKTEHKASIDHLGGIIEKVGQLINVFSPANLLGAKTESKFQGDGATERKGELSARLTATVTHLFENGNMAIRGEQHIKMNNEEQLLLVEGIIRPYDILPDNTVLSTSVADARITYRGFGVVAERQRPGWLVRLLDYVWPF